MKKLSYSLVLPIAAMLLSSSCGNGTPDKTADNSRDSVTANHPGVLYKFEQGDFIGFKDAKGNTVLPARYTYTYSDTFSHKVAIVIDSVDGPSVIDKAGKKVLSPFIYDNGPDYIVENVFRVVDANKKMGFADLDGNIVVPMKYDFISEFKDSMACFGSGYKEERQGEITMMTGGKWGFINHRGDTVVKPIYDGMNWFEGGTCTLKRNGKSVVIDKNGKEVK